MKAYEAHPMNSHHYRLWLAIVIAIALFMRLIAVLFSELAPGDGVSRLERAYEWAFNPRWEGLVNVWPPLHWYVEGLLIRLWEQPLFWANFLGLLFGMGTVYLIFRTTYIAGFGLASAGWAGVVTALYWAHIWLTTTNLVETKYLFFIFLTVYYLLLARADQSKQSLPLWAGISLFIALLLRHEAKLMALVFLVWAGIYLPRVQLVRFVVPVAIGFAIQFIDPLLRGSTFFEIIAQYRSALHADITVRDITIGENLRRWVLMVGVSPSFIIVLLSLHGLWLRRHYWKEELFLWLMAVQLGSYVASSLNLVLVPQIRYTVLAFIYLIPYASYSLDVISTRFRLIPLIVIGVMLIIQPIGWWQGRNEGRPLGWLPIYRYPEAQRTLELWLQQTPQANRIWFFEGYPQEWSIRTAIIRLRRFDLLGRAENALSEQTILKKGKTIEVPEDVDYLLVNPRRVDYLDNLIQSLPPSAQKVFEAPSLWVFWIPVRNEKTDGG